MFSFSEKLLYYFFLLIRKPDNPLREYHSPKLEKLGWKPFDDLNSIININYQNYLKNKI